MADADVKSILDKFKDSFTTYDTMYGNLTDAEKVEVEAGIESLYTDFAEKRKLGKILVIVNSDASQETGTRWLKNLFYEGGRTKRPRLDEIHAESDPNTSGGTDISDYGLASDILLRAGLTDHVRFKDLTNILAIGLQTIEDPMKWCNPNAEVSETSEPAKNGLTTDVVEMSDSSNDSSSSSSDSGT